MLTGFSLDTCRWGSQQVRLFVHLIVSHTQKNKYGFLKSCVLQAVLTSNFTQIHKCFRDNFYILSHLRPVVVVHFFWSITSSVERVLFQDRDQRYDFPVIVLAPLSCRELIFSTCSYESDQTFCVLFDESAGSACTPVCVYLLKLHLCSLWLISVKKLGHGVCKGACSNYCQLCSLNALPYCTLLLHQPDITIILQSTLSLAASSGNLQHLAPWSLLYTL